MRERRRLKEERRAKSIGLLEKQPIGVLAWEWTRSAITGRKILPVQTGPNLLRVARRDDHLDDLLQGVPELRSDGFTADDVQIAFRNLPKVTL
jgi:hypothetical protein